MSDVLTAHQLQHPPTWRDIFRRRGRPSALELACAALEECRREALDQAQSAEYHAAMTKMLKEREARLLKEVQRLSKAPPTGLFKADSGED